jgi:pSer/pThr/pTyr-binding forkhead associated (FHA) protein
MYALKDLASTNGTTINGRPISVASLKNGDVISFGGVDFRFVARVQG